jgi:pyruvate dehydrogenase E1 component
VTVATLSALLREKQIEASVVTRAIKELEIDPEKVNPAIG